MARTRSSHPTDGELELLQILWQIEPAGLGQICEVLRQQRPIATTTVATMLNVMLDKKLVLRKRSPQGYLWTAKATRQNAASSMIRKLIDSVFDGSASRLVTHLMESNELSEEERQEVRRLIDEK